MSKIHDPRAMQDAQDALRRLERAVFAFRCPTCGALVGEPCKGGTGTHKRRLARVPPHGK